MSIQTTLNHPHPLLLIAASSVIVLSLAGIGALAGWLPVSAASVAAVTAAGVNPNTQVAAAAEPLVPATRSPAPAKPELANKPTTARVGAGKTAANAHSGENHVEVDVIPAPSSAPATATTDKATVESPAPVACVDCGTIDAIDEIQVPGSGTGGSIVGGVVGGILGNQIGKGTTRDIATLIGIAGGALAGRHIEQATSKTTRYETAVRLDDGSRRVFSSDTRPSWRSGDKVRIQNGEVVARP